MTTSKGNLVASVTSAPDPGKPQMYCEGGEKNGIRCTALHTDCGPNPRVVSWTTNSEGEKRPVFTNSQARKCHHVQWSTFVDGSLRYQAQGVSVMLPVGDEWTVIQMSVVNHDGTGHTAHHEAFKGKSTGPVMWREHK